MKNIFYLCTSLSLYSCGPNAPDLNIPTQSMIEVPGYQNPYDSMQLLDEEDSKRLYTGSLLLWSNDLTAELAKQTLEQSIAIKEKDLSYKSLAFQDDDYYHQIKQLQTKLENLEKRKSTISSREIDDFFIKQQNDGLSYSAKSWFATHAKKESHEALISYCKAKIWEMASSKKLNQLYFIERPSPAIYCENYYEENGFFTAPECSPSADGKSYFACYWGKSGVFKTAPEVIIKDEEGEKTEATELQLAALHEHVQSPGFLSYAQTTEPRILRRLLSFTLHNEKLKAFISIDDETISNWLEESLDEYFTHSSLEVLGQLNQPLIDRDDWQLTLHDRIFSLHLTIGSRKMSVPSQKLQDTLTPLSNSLKPVFGKEPLNFVELAAKNLKALKDEIDHHRRYKVEMESKRELLKATVESRRQTWLKAKQITAMAMHDSKAVQALWPYAQLTVEKNNKTLKVRFTLDSIQSTKTLTGCFQVDTKMSLTCHSEEELPLDLKFDDKTGEITLTVKISKSNQTGLKKTSFKDYRFQKTSNDQIENATLLIKMHPRMLGDTLPSMTGDITISRQNSKPHLFGAINLSMPEMVKD